MSDEPCTTESEPSERTWRLWCVERLRNHAGLVTLFAVLCLLKGPWGAGVALWTHIHSMSDAFLGDTSGELKRVAWQTLPLLLPSAVLTFLLLRRWFPGGMLAVYAVVVIVAGSAWLSREIDPPSESTTEVVGASSVIPSSAAPNTPTEPPIEMPVFGGVQPLGLPIGEQSNQPPLPKRGERYADRPQRLASLAESPAGLTDPETRTHNLSEFNRRRWRRHRVPPPAMILPAELPGIAGQTCDTVNQVGGYVWEYGVNLSLAAVILGGYFGWLWHDRLSSATRLAAFARGVARKLLGRE